jgi:hypothetical protein
MLMQKPLCWNCSTEDVTEMPRCFSISIQSEVAARARFPLTSPAWAMAPPYSRNFSVSVVLPASGWEMMAKVLRREISVRSSDMEYPPEKYQSMGHLRPTALLRRPSVLPRQNLGEGRIHSARSKRKSELPQKRQLLWDDDGEGPPPGNFSA